MASGTSSPWSTWRPGLKAPPPWLEQELLPSLASKFVAKPTLARIGAKFRMFREAFAGCARLTQFMRAAGVSCARPLEPYPSPDNSKKRTQAYIRANDIMEQDVLFGLRADIQAGYYLALHFGICCGGGRVQTR